MSQRRDTELPTKPVKRQSSQLVSSNHPRTIEELRLGLIGAAQFGDPDWLRQMIRAKAPVNYQERGTGATALHYIAGQASRAALRVLIKNNDVNYLLRDCHGRLSSEMALVFGRDAAMARLLRRKEALQAQKEGIKLTLRPRHDK